MQTITQSIVRVGSHTPWGPVQHAEDIAPGITFVSTAGHGGFLLSQEKHAKVQQKFPQFNTFAGGQWYEEDCDVATVIVTFPEYFSEEQVRVATNCVKRISYYGPIA